MAAYIGSRGRYPSGAPVGQQVLKYGQKALEAYIVKEAKKVVTDLGKTALKSTIKKIKGSKFPRGKLRGFSEAPPRAAPKHRNHALERHEQRVYQKKLKAYNKRLVNFQNSNNSLKKPTKPSLAIPRRHPDRSFKQPKSIPKKMAFNSRGGSQSSYVDIALNNVEMNNDGAIALINTVPQGAGTSQRIGRKWNITSASFSFLFQGVTSGNFPVNTRMWLIWDKMPQGSLPTMGDLFANPTDLHLTSKNDSHSKRFTILRDWQSTQVGSTSNASCIVNPKVMKYEYVSFGKNGKTVLNRDAATGAIGDIEIGALYLVYSAQAAAGGSAAPGLYAKIRIRYHDIVGR